MKTIIFAFILCLFSLNVFSQNGDSKFSYGVSFNPHLSNITHKITPGYEYIYEYLTYRHPKMGWTTGSYVRYEITKNLSLQLGINLSNKGFAGHDPLDYYKIYRDTLNLLAGKYPEKQYYRGNHYYFDFPVSLRHIIFELPKLKFYNRIGIMPNFYFASKGYIKTQFNDGSVDTYYDHHNFKYLNHHYRIFEFSGILATGIEYSFNEKLGFIVEPNFDMFIFPLSSHPVKSRYYNIGIRFGLVIQ